MSPLALVSPGIAMVCSVRVPRGSVRGSDSVIVRFSLAKWPVMFTNPNAAVHTFPVVTRIPAFPVAVQ